MDDLRFTPAILVTGQDDKGNLFTWWSANDKFVDGYNECFVTADEFRKVYQLVGKVYFNDVVMSGDSWRAMQCPLSLSNEQIDAWISQPVAVDEAWYAEMTARHADDLDEKRTLREASA